MRHSNTRFFALLFLAGYFAPACNFEKIKLEYGTCFTSTIIDCTDAGVVYEFDASCSPSPETVVWKIQDDPVPISETVIQYVFSDKSRSYSVNLTIQSKGEIIDTTFIIDAADTKGLNFTKKIDLPESQLTQDMAVLPNGGYAICGSQTGATVSAFVTFTDRKGEIIWHKTYDAPGADSTFANSIVANPDGSVAIAGWAKVNGLQKVFVAIIDASGGAENIKVLPDPAGDETIGQRAFSIDRAKNIDYLICGHRDDNPNTNGQDMLLRLNDNLAITQYTPMGNAGAFQIKAIDANAFLVVGSRFLPHGLDANGFPIQPFNPVFHVSKWKSSLSADWGFQQTEFSNPMDIEKKGYSAVLLADGRVVACGSIKQTPTAKPKIWIEVFNSNGILNRVIQLPDGIVATDIIESVEKDGIILACTAAEDNSGDFAKQNFLLIKVSLGNDAVVWTKTINHSGVFDNAVSLAASRDCGYIAVGRTAQGESGGATSPVLVRTDFNGD